jgi:hypothetical protein
MEISLADKVKQWIEKEGYPLEFSTAYKFKNRNFSVEQSYFSADKNGKTREVDVLASKSVSIGRSILRINHVVECKWSKDKPWVLFKDEKRFATSALAAQLISSSAGQAITWAAAGNKQFKNLAMFKEDGFSFSGRQAFTSTKDLFYQAVQGVVSNCLNITRSYDVDVFNPSGRMLAVIALPMIVVDGSLFEATYDSEGNELKLESIDHARLCWRGNEGRQLNTIIDVVTSDHLDTFLKNRELELEVLINCLGETLEQLNQCLQEKTDKYLVITKGPRGISGRPNVLRKLHEISASNK